MGDKGWIKLDRAVMDLPFWNDAEKAKAYIDLLLMANYKDSKVVPRGGSNVMTIHEGQVFTSIETLMGIWGWSKNRVLGYIKMLEKLDLGYAKGYAFGTIITLKNIDAEAFHGTAKGTADGTTHGTSHGTAKGTPKGTAHGTADGTRIKKEKKDKKDKNQTNKQDTQCQDLGFVWGELE